MPDILVLLLAASGTALATGLGAIPVFVLGDRAERLTPFLLGLASGVMGVASIAGLLIPGFQEGSVGQVFAGLALGGLLILVLRRHLRADISFHGHSGASTRTSVLVF